MSLRSWIIIYLVNFGFWMWAFFLGGAEMLGGRPISGIFGFIFTLKWRVLNSEGIKALGWVILFFHTIFFIIGITTPGFREFFNII